MRGLKKLFSVEVRIRNSFVLLKFRNVYLSNWALRYFFREEDSYLPLPQSSNLSVRLSMMGTSRLSPQIKNLRENK